MIGLARREPAACWRANPELVITDTDSIAFADAAEDDRVRWLNAFRRLLDGLDSPLHVVIHVRPGLEAEQDTQPAEMPDGWDDMRGADLVFAEHIRRATSPHRVTTSLVTDRKAAARLH